MKFFIKLEQIILKFIWNYKSTQNAKAILRKKRRWKKNPPRQYYISKLQSLKEHDAGLKTEISQWNEIECPEIKSPTYGQLIYNKGGKNI